MACHSVSADAGMVYQATNRGMAGAATPELGPKRGTPRSGGSVLRSGGSVLKTALRPEREESQLFGVIRELQRINYSLLVAFCCRHQPPPDRKGPARQITEPASASGGRAAPPDPCQGQDLSYGGGSTRGEIGLFPARDKAAAGRLAPRQQEGSRYS